VNAAARVNGVQSADAHPAPAHSAPVRPTAAHPVTNRPGKVNAAR
jgi:hypothetical protein